MSATRVDPNLAGAIEQARQHAGVTKFQLAVRSGLSLGTIRMATQGIATVKTLLAISRVLQVDFDALAGRKRTASEAA